jgi:pimeloyl-ACP methyl ester carboxylesterase
MDVRQATVTAGDLEVAYLECGDGPLALCLHGFPDCAWTWRFLLPALSDAGFRAVAPWLRGYAPTAIPDEGHYQTGAMVVDACNLHEALGGDGDAVIIGHDWGAIGATGAAAFAPERWRRLVTAAVPPSGAIGQAFLLYEQLRRSWYMFFFQSPLAHVVVAMDDLAFIDRLWADWSPGYDARDDLPRVKEALRLPDNLSAAIGYYRAALGTDPQAPELEGEQAATGATPPQPHLYLHGQDDGCMGIDIGRLAPPFLNVPGSRFEEVPKAGHFLHVEQPDTFNRLVVEFVTS